MTVKKFLSVLLCFAVILSTFTVVASSENEIDFDNTEAITFFERLSVLPENFQAEKSITFSEFVSLAMKITGMSYTASEGEKSIFADADTYDEHYGALKLAYDMGIISGYGDGTVGYDEKITTARASKILVSMLGYDVRAQSVGGYPSGYIIVSGQLGILDDINADANSYLTWSQAVQLVYNCLDVELLQQKSYPDGKYVTVDDETPLTQWMKFSKTEGIITANAFTTNEGGEGVEDGYVVVDGVRYFENGAGISSLLGYSVEIWYKEAYGKNVVMYAKASDETEVYTVSTADFSSETSGQNVYYYKEDSDKVSKLKIADNALYLHNFKYCTPEYGLENLIPSNGSVIFTDIDGNGSVDVVNIKNSTTYVVKETNVNNLIIYDAYGQPNLRLGDEDVRVVIKKDNLDASFEDIKSNNVLTVTKSSDGEYIEVIIGVKKIKGIVQEMGDNFIVVNNRRFGILSQNKDKIKSIIPGTEITLLLDFNLKSAGYIEGVEDSTDYGYLIVAQSRAQGLSEKTTFKIFATDGEVKTFETAEGITLNGKRRTESGEELKGSVLVNQFMDGETFVHQLVKYALNEEGKLSKIETAKENCYKYGGTGQYDEEFSHDYSYRKGDTRANYVFFKTGGLLGNEYNLNGTVGITVPSADIWAGGNMSEIEKSFGIFNPMISWGADKRVTEVDLYDVSETKKPKIVLEYGAGGSPLCGPEFMLVEEITEALDDEGMPAMFIKGMYKGEYQRLQVKTDADMFVANPSLLTLQSGDVIRVGRDALGKVINLIKVFTINRRTATGPYVLYSDCYDAKTGGENSQDITSYKEYDFCNFDASAMYAIHATSYYLETDSVWGTHIAVNLGKRDESSRDLSLKLMRFDKTTGFYYYDVKTETLRLATEDDLCKDENKTVVIRSRYAIATDVIIINHEDPVTGVYWVGGFDT